MKTHSYSMPLRIAALCGILFSHSTRAAVLISDSFTTGDGTGVNGAVLNGVTTEVGGATWIAPNSLEFRAVGDIILHTDNGIGSNNTRIGHLNIIAASTITGQITQVSGGVTSTDTDTNHWAAVGYALNPLSVSDSNFWTAGVGQLWMLINGVGGYSVYANGTSNLLTTGTFAGFLGGGAANDIAILYDQPNNTASAFINGQAVLSGYNLSGIGFTPTISAVGFHLRGPFPSDSNSTQPSLTSFNFESVPEPSRALLLACAAMASLSRRRRTST